MTQGHLRSHRRWTAEEIAQLNARNVAAILAPAVEIRRPAEVCNEPFGGFSFRLPWPPSVNNAYGNSKGNGRTKSKKYCAFAGAASLELLAQKVPVRCLAHPMAITIVQHTSSDRGDLDNYIKVIIDVMKRYGVIADDHRGIIRRIVVEDGYRVERGEEFVDVTVSCVHGALLAIGAVTV